MRPNAGAVVSDAFKFTEQERTKIAAVIQYIVTKGEIDRDITINRIEAIINQGWQTCDCELTQQTGPVE